MKRPISILANSSIRTKVKLGILLVSGISVILVSTSFFIYEYVVYRERLATDLVNKAVIIGENSNAAVAFRDSADASNVLNSLATQSDIVAAAIYDEGGIIFASYFSGDNGASLPERPGPEGWAYNGSFLTVFQPIMLNGDKIGSIYLSMSLEVFSQRLWSFAVIAMLVLSGGFLIAYPFAAALARGVSDPILELAGIAQEVSEKKNFSLRASKTTTDETGLLAEAFNDMLSRIQEHEGEIRTLNAELEERVRVRTAELEVTNKELESFSYSVSHDLRAPLRHIDGFSQLLQKTLGDSVDGKATRYIDTISESAKRMGQLIDELLIFSRMGRAEMQNTVCDMEKLLAEVRDEMKDEVEKRNVEMEVDSLPVIHGDPAMLRLVWVNLLSNALKYSRKQQSPRVEIGCEERDAEYVFHVRDNGAGFDMKYVDKLFGVFQRLHRSNDFEGTGIGLANVKRIVTRHSGRVWAEGAVDNGATFYFTIHKRGKHG